MALPVSSKPLATRGEGSRRQGAVSTEISVNEKPRKPLTMRELADFPALIDGKGLITSNWNRLQVSIKMTRKGIVEWLSSFGGNRSFYDPKGNCMN